MTDYRAALDAVVRFGNGGDLTVHGFRVDVPSRETGEAEIAALFVASLGLLMTDSVKIRFTLVRNAMGPAPGTFVNSVITWLSASMTAI